MYFVSYKDFLLNISRLFLHYKNFLCSSTFMCMYCETEFSRNKKNSTVPLLYICKLNSVIQWPTLCKGSAWIALLTTRCNDKVCKTFPSNNLSHWYSYYYFLLGRKANEELRDADFSISFNNFRTTCISLILTYRHWFWFYVHFVRSLNIFDLQINEEITISLVERKIIRWPLKRMKLAHCCQITDIRELHST